MTLYNPPPDRWRVAAAIEEKDENSKTQSISFNLASTSVHNGQANELAYLSEFSAVQSVADVH